MSEPRITVEIDLDELLAFRRTFYEALQYAIHSPNDPAALRLMLACSARLRGFPTKVTVHTPSEP